MPMGSRCLAAMIAATVVLTGPALGQERPGMPTAADHRSHQESARRHEGMPPPDVETPPLPEGMTLDEVLDTSSGPTPLQFPDPVPDDRLYGFTLLEQLEYRIVDDGAFDHLGWKAQGWIGGDFNKFWWKNEGEAVFDGSDEGASETELLYSRLVAPFWNVQVGAQYANEWTTDTYDDRWSGVIALQGLAPYKFELENSLYLSEDGDVTFSLEAEYDVRITQRLVIQPRAELGFAAQDIPNRNLGAGMTDANLGLRLRYEIKREFAPYVGIRCRFLVGETGNIAEAAGADTGQFFYVAGVRFAF